MTCASAFGRWLLCAAGFVVASAASAATAWDESVSGDLASDGLSPTALSVALGDNLVLGTVGNAGNGIDRDYFRFTVPGGARLVSLILQANTTISGGASFLALQAGPQVTTMPTGAGSENLLGFVHYSSDMVGQDLLPLLAAGFSGGLPSGTYSAWVQETGGPVSYGLNLTLSAVPEPASALLLLAGLMGTGLAGRRNRHLGR